MVNLEQKTKLKIKEFISEYNKFMKIDHLPEFSVETFVNNEELRVTFDSQIPILHINETYTSILKSNSKPTIFHEFTHILDNYSLLTKLSKEEKEPLIKMYSEYHAGKHK